jgi:hypothetical protein
MLGVVPPEESIGDVAFTAVTGVPICEATYVFTAFCDGTTISLFSDRVPSVSIGVPFVNPWLIVSL